MDHSPTPEELERIVRQTFDDHRLSRSERRALGQVLGDLHGDASLLRCVRNRAFEVASAAMKRAEDRTVLEWVEGLVREIDKQLAPEVTAEAEAHFSPGHECRNRIIGLCGSCTRTMDVCVYTITDNRIKDALFDARRRRVRVRIITDDAKTRDLGSDIHDLHRQGIEVTVDDSPAHMHHKFAIFDGRTLLNGSFNWTRNASSENEENIVVTNDQGLVRQFQDVFDELWESFPSL